MPRTRFTQKLQRLFDLAIAKEQGLVTDAQIGVILDPAWQRMIRENQDSTAISRRRFLGGAAAGIVSGSMIWGACKQRRIGNSQSLSAGGQEPGRIIIVGGGIAGLTVAYRLYQAKLPCAIFEGSDRLGGRVYTQKNFNKDGMFCDLGGEFFDPRHSDLVSLCRELTLEIQDINDDISLAEDRFFFGGKKRSPSDIISAFAPMAKTILADTKRLNLDGKITIPTYHATFSENQALKKLDRTPLKEYIEHMRCDPWLTDLVDLCCMSMTGGESTEQSALNLLTIMNSKAASGIDLFAESSKIKRIKGGNDGLPRALQEVIKSAVAVHSEHRLVAIKDSGTSFTLVFDQGGKTREEVADIVVIATPLSTLKDVDLSKIELSPTKKLALETWGYGTSSKLMMGFNSKPWRTNPTSALGHLYGEFSSQSFWESNCGQDGSSGIMTNLLSGAPGAAVPAGQLQVALRDLDALFPGAAKAYDSNKFLQHWPSLPFSRGSYTSMRPGQYTTIFGSPREPELGGRLFFAGEHCSIEFSGSMNGAVQSGNETAKNVLESAGWTSPKA